MESAHHFILSDQLFVDTAFLRAFSSGLVHLGWGDFATLDKSVKFLRVEAAFAPPEFVGRIHAVSHSGDHADLIAAANSTETPVPVSLREGA